MMFFDLRIVCFDCSYNRHTTNQKAIYFDSEEALIELFDNSNQIGTYENLSELAHTEYTWKKVKSQYESLLANASKM